MPPHRPRQPQAADEPAAPGLDPPAAVLQHLQRVTEVALNRFAIRGGIAALEVKKRGLELLL